MSDRTDLPYEKAIEEADKTGGKALYILDKASPAIGTVYNWMIGDRVAAARERNLDSLQRKTRRIIEERNIADKQPLPESLALPLLEAAQGETREEIQDLYAALLANAMNPDFTDDVRPEFIETVKALQPFDAKILVLVPELSEPTGQYQDKARYSEVVKRFPGQRPTAIRLSIDHLVQLGCIANAAGLVNLTAYGTELLNACDFHATNLARR
jgi:hypothetical protein